MLLPAGKLPLSMRQLALTLSGLCNQMGSDTRLIAVAVAGRGSATPSEAALKLRQNTNTHGGDSRQHAALKNIRELCAGQYTASHSHECPFGSGSY